VPTSRVAIIIWVAAALGVSSPVVAQELVIVPKLRVGDEFHLQVTRTRQNAARPEQNGKTTTAVSVTVVAASTEGTTIDWVPGETTFSDGRTAQDPVIQLASKAMEGFRLRISLDNEGAFAGLANEAEVKPKLQAMLDVIVGEAIKQVPEAERQSFQGLITQMLSPAVLIAAATNDAQTYFSLNGVVIDVGEQLEAALEQPNPLGGGTLPAKFRIKAESATPESAVLVTSTTYDQAAFLSLIKQIAEKAGKALTADEIAKLPAVEIADDGRFVVDRGTGLMREVAAKRRVSGGTMLQRFDGWDIRLVQGPKR
jgi:hypothetical protein